MGVGGIASAAHGLDILQRFPRSLLKPIELAIQGRGCFAMSRCIAGGGHSTVQLERRCRHPVAIGFNRCIKPSLMEPVPQCHHGLPGELFRLLGFSDSAFQLDTGLGWKHSLGRLVNGAATDAADPKREQQQQRGGAAAQRPTTDLTRDMQWT